MPLQLSEREAAAFFAQIKRPMPEGPEKPVEPIAMKPKALAARKRPKPSTVPSRALVAISAPRLPVVRTHMWLLALLVLMLVDKLMGI